MTILHANHENTLYVGWDSEYNTDPFIPISSQLYIHQTGDHIFIDHVGRKPRIEEIIRPILSRCPDATEIKMISHFDKAEFMSLEDGVDLIFNPESKIMAVNNSLINFVDVQVDGRVVTLDFIDTFLLYPASLAKLGEMIGEDKLSTGGYRESGNMLEWYHQDPEAFRAYALKDAELVVKFYMTYQAMLQKYGLNIAKTVGGIYERSLFNELTDCDAETLKRLGYIEKPRRSKGKIIGKEMVNTGPVKNFESSYAGGRNETYAYGYRKGKHTDWDLISAYTSSLSLMPEWDFDHPFVTTDPQALYQYMMENPLANGWVDLLQYRFKPGTKYPSLAVKSDNSLVFPLSGGGANEKSRFTLQEFMVSYPHLDECTVVGVAFKPMGDSPIAEFTRKLRDARLEAKRNGDQLGDAVLKLVGNSGYGKFAQGLVGKQGISFTNSTRERLVREPVPKSKISNPAIAAFITGCCRAAIGEYLHTFDKLGIGVTSVTTDGFILQTDSLPDELLYGAGAFTKYLSSRLGGSPILELKHYGDEVLSLKTRGYYLKGEKSLFAMTGVSLRGKSDQERIAFMDREFKSLSLFKSTKYPLTRLPSLRDWIIDGATPDNIHEEKTYNFDFDLKRKPINAIEVDGYLRFGSDPFDSIEEYLSWREAYRDFDRGKRDKHGRQVGIVNKLHSIHQLDRFIEYVTIRDANFESVAYQTDNTGLRVVANIAHQYLGYGFKRIAKELGAKPEAVRYWVRTRPMKPDELAKRQVLDIMSKVLAGMGVECDIEGTLNAHIPHPPTDSPATTLINACIQAWRDEWENIGDQIRRAVEARDLARTSSDSTSDHNTHPDSGVVAAPRGPTFSIEGLVREKVSK